MLFLHFFFSFLHSVLTGGGFFFQPSTYYETSLCAAILEWEPEACSLLSARSSELGELTASLSLPELPADC